MRNQLLNGLAFQFDYHISLIKAYINMHSPNLLFTASSYKYTRSDKLIILRHKIFGKSPSELDCNLRKLKRSKISFLWFFFSPITLRYYCIGVDPLVIRLSLRVQTIIPRFLIGFLAVHCEWKHMK